MAKSTKFPQTNVGASTPRPMSAGQHAHFRGLATNLIDNAVAVGHGHMVGKQGPKGHVMPPSDAHKQQGAYLPQGVAQNRQNTFSDSGSADANRPHRSRQSPDRKS